MASCLKNLAIFWCTVDVESVVTGSRSFSRALPVSTQCTLVTYSTITSLENELKEEAPGNAM
uniref:Uncharacterized protein n=1 Tax=Rhodnius prolixus TaxID=13249 RepID=T1HKK8_RHOPR